MTWNKFAARPGLPPYNQELLYVTSTDDVSTTDRKTDTQKPNKIPAISVAHH